MQMQAQTEKEKELIDVLMNSSKSKALEGFICIVSVQNNVPPEHRVSIIGIATDFDYTDGSTYRDIDEPINVPYGGTARTESNDATKCVKSTFIGIKVQQHGFPPTALVTRRDAPQDKCLVDVPIVLGLQSSVTEAELNSGVESVLKLTVLSES